MIITCDKPRLFADMNITLHQRLAVVHFKIGDSVDENKQGKDMIISRVETWEATNVINLTNR